MVLRGCSVLSSSEEMVRVQSSTLWLYLPLLDAVNLAVNADKNCEYLLSRGEYFRIDTLPTSLLLVLPQCTQLWENYF